MCGTRQKYQVVILIDVSAGVPCSETDTSTDHIVPCICLSTMRILTHLANLKTGNAQTHVKWGFKFYNSLCPLIQEYKFNEFTVKDFREFETLVDTVIESEKSKSHGLVKDRLLRTVSFSESESSRDCFPTNNGICLDYDNDPVDKLQTALRDIVTDFQWDRPDISSPVRSMPRRSSIGRKRGKTREDGEARQQNFIFLFSRCPYSPPTIASFCGVAEDASPQDVLSSFLPTSLYRQFYESAKIRLFWVDLNADPGYIEKVYNKEFSVHGIDLMHEALSAVGGGVLPPNALLQMGTYTSTPICQLLQRSSSPATLHAFANSLTQPEGLLVPLSALFKWYLHDPLRRPLQQPGVLTARILVDTGPCQEVLGEVEMHTVVMPNESDRNHMSAAGHRDHSECSKLEIIDITDEEQDANRHFSFALTRPTGTTLSAAPSDVTSAEVIMNPARRCTLRVQGTVCSGGLPMEWLRSDAVFTVRLSTHTRNHTFVHLLQELARKQISLVVDYQYDHLGASCLGLIQPFTSELATFTLIKSEVTANVEKILFFPNEAIVCDESEMNRDDIKASVSKTIKHLCTDNEKDGLVDDGGSAEVISTADFHVNILERWMTGTIGGITTNCLIQSLTNSEDHARVEAVEVHALHEVQKLYHEVKYGRHPSRVSNATPKKKALSSPRKTATRKSPRKTPKKKTPRKSLVQSGKRRTPRKTPKKKQAGAKGKMGKKASHMAHHRSDSFSAPLSRTAMIIQRSQQVATQVTEEGDVEEGREESATNGCAGPKLTPYLPLKELETEADLLAYLGTQYESGVTATTTPLTCAQSMVSVALHYLKSADTEKPEVATGMLFQQGLLKTTNDIKEKYTNAANDEDTHLRNAMRLQEYELQVLLHLELESLLVVIGRTDEDWQPTVKQVSSMLARMTLLKDSAYVASFMKAMLIDNYLETMPRLLGDIYEELLIPLPHELAGLFSGSDNDDASSVQPTSAQSDMSSVAAFSNPESNHSTRARCALATIPSFNIVTKRQIAVPAKVKVPDKEKKKVKKTSRAASTKKVKQSRSAKAEVTQVRRNLFMGGQMPVGKLERHKSVAVMESVGSKPPSTPNKRIHKLAATTPKSHHIIKTKKVTETPVHRQVRGVMWHRLEKERQRAYTISNVNIVQESPDKLPFKGSKNAIKRRSSLGNLCRSSFYSNDLESKSRNVEKYKQLEARMTNVNPLVSPTREKMPPKCSPPRRINPVNLFANLSSPSPPKMAQFQRQNVVVAPGLQSRILGFDSPSKNTRTRSLFAPPEIEHPNATLGRPVKASPRKRVSLHFDALGQGVSASGSGRISRGSPRRVSLQSCQLSPQKSSRALSSASSPKGFPQSSFLSPVKTYRSRMFSTCLSPLVKTQNPATPVKGNLLVSPSRPLPPTGSLRFTTPHRPQRHGFPLTPDAKSVSVANFTPNKKTTQKNVRSLQSPTREQQRSLISDHIDISEKSPQKPLRQTPQRKARSLTQTFAQFDSLDDTLPVDDISLSPPRKKRFGDRVVSPSNNAPVVKSILPIEQTVAHTELADNRQLRRSPRFSPRQSKTTQCLPPQSTSAVVVENIVVSAERKTIAQSDSECLSPPSAKVKKPATPSKVSAKLDRLVRRVMTGGSGDCSFEIEGISGRALVPVVKRLSSSSNENQTMQETQPSELRMTSLFSARGETQRGVSCIDSPVPRASGDFTNSTPGTKRNLLPDHNSAKDDDKYAIATLGTNPKRRRTLRSRQSEDSFDGSEVFVSSGSAKSSPVSTIYPCCPSLTLRRVNNRLRRDNSAGSDSSTNVETDVPMSPVIGSTNNMLRHLNTQPSECGSDTDNSLPTSPVFKRSGGTPVTTESVSPACGTRTPSSSKNYSPSISAMSLAHLMQSPLVDDNKRRPTTRPARSSRRSLYRTRTNLDGDV